MQGYKTFSITICKDASLEDLDASMVNVSSGEAWLLDEKLIHLNVFDIKVILLALRPFVKTSHEHIKLMFDNTTETHCIKKLEHHIQWNAITKT